MNAIDILIHELQGSLQVLQWTVADFSDDELLVRPVPRANHAAWLLGHLASAEAGFVRELQQAGVGTPGIERFKDIAPTVAATAMLQASHMTMHLGQLQVIRRRLGKPVLF